jgi:protein deglycase
MKEALLPLMEGFEEIEAITIIDILRRGGVMVVTAGLESVIVEGAHGITIVTDRLMDHVIGQEFDLVVIAGGAGTFRLNNDPRVKEILQKHGDLGKFIGAICAAPLVLSAAGLLKGKKITSYPAIKDKLIDTEYLEIPVVVDDNIITSRGVATAIPFALKLVELLQGEAIAQEVSKNVLFD